jgi:hypothetical protein
MTGGSVCVNSRNKCNLHKLRTMMAQTCVFERTASAKVVSGIDIFCTRYVYCPYQELGELEGSVIYRNQYCV